ncbi:MAG: condensation domain-containing protein, partial [Acidobacteriota bacterium]|nr:condensation domain-containing protein [Acidobacteriota bacterium]
VRRQEEARLTGGAVRRPFDLARGPLCRALLLRTGLGEWLLVLAMHHIVSDGWSVGVMLRELEALYGAAAGGLAAPRRLEELLPELPLQYADYAIWQRQLLAGPALASQLAYWHERLAGCPPLLSLPADRQRPAVQSFRGSTVPLRLAAGVSDRLRQLCRQTGVSLFMTALAGFFALLHRYTGQADLLVGTPVAGRGQMELEGLIGFFANTLPVRADLSGDPRFAELLGRVREATLGAHANGDLPFERLVEALAPERDLAWAPLVQVVFALETAPPEPPRLPGVEAEELPQGSDTAKVDLIAWLTETSSGLAGVLEVNRDIFDAATAHRMASHLAILLAGVAADPPARLSELPLLAAAERQELLFAGNRARELRGEPSIHGRFIEWARATPRAVAVIAPEGQITYGELEARASALCRRLRASRVGPETLVALCAERSIEMVVAVLAILKAGGAYVPLDPSYPRERLALLLADSGAPVLLTQERLAAALPPSGAVRVILLEGPDGTDGDLAGEAEGASLPVGGDNLAYVIYTSGSTGQPKGVAVPHRAVVGLVSSADYVQLGPGDRVAQAANASFDAATFEIWGPLLNGGTLVILPHEIVLQPAAFAAEIRRQGIRTLFLTTALFNQAAREAPGAFAPLANLLFGGEAVDPGQVLAVLRDGPPERLLHVYGPTENTTFSTWYEVHDVERGAATV